MSATMAVTNRETWLQAKTPTCPHMFEKPDFFLEDFFVVGLAHYVYLHIEAFIFY